MVNDETRWNILARNSHAMQYTSDGAEWGWEVERRIRDSMPEASPWYDGWFFAATLRPRGERYEDMET